MCEGWSEPYDGFTGENKSDAENVPDAEIRRTKSLKLKFGLPPRMKPTMCLTPKLGSKSLKFKFGLPPG